MATTLVGYNIFKGASQAGTDDGTAGTIQIETSASGKYKVRLVRSADSYYWDTTSGTAGAFVAGAPAPAAELDVPGSYNPSGPDDSATIRRLEFRLPALVIAGVVSGTLTITAYPASSTPAASGKAVVVDFASL